MFGQGLSPHPNPLLVLRRGENIELLFGLFAVFSVFSTIATVLLQSQFMAILSTQIATGVVVVIFALLALEADETILAHMISE